MKGIQDYSKEGDSPSSRGDNTLKFLKNLLQNQLQRKGIALLQGEIIVKE
jgi:hypothetical protein